MSNIREAFKNGKAFIPFVTCGDPTLEVTEEIVIEMEKAGADLIELRIPFSDPTAEGPVICEANLRALSNKITTDDVFDMVIRLRKTVKVPMVFMTYANVIFTYGAERFFSKCSEIGMDGVILPDIPYEERMEFEPVCKKYGVDLIFLIAPTSHDRIKEIAENASGFLYCVSSLGVTGMRSSISTNIGEMIETAKSVSEIPCAVGFGISTPEQARELSRFADGVIVGSAIVKLCQEHGKDSPKYISNYVMEIKKAMK